MEGLGPGAGSEAGQSRVDMAVGSTAMARTSVVVICFLHVCSAISRDLLYPHGTGIDSVLPQDQDEASSPELTLKVPIVFYSEVYNSIYVSSQFV